MTAEPTTGETANPPRAPRWTRRCVVTAAAVVALLAALFAVVRLAPLTDAGRAAIVARLDGLSVGPLGRLHVAGLTGDVWSDFTLDQLSIADAAGPWLQARHIHIRWRPSRLLRRRIHAQLLQIDQLTLLRRPVLRGGGAGGGGGLPVSIFVDHLGVRLETLPAFSVVRGLFQMDMNLDIARKGGVAGSITSRNLFHPGDGLDARFDLGVGRKVLLDGRAHESSGGALAGMLGLPVAQAVNIDAKASGDVVEGQSHFLAYSGQTPIAQIQGQWTKAGGGVGGWASLAASSWTAPLQHAFGPRLDFTFKHSQVRGALRDVDLEVATDNVTVSVAGPLDTGGRRSVGGLKLSLRAKDLSRLIERPTMGAGAIDGLWRGSLDDWTLNGQAQVQRLALGEYLLARANGPIQLTYRRRELRLGATVIGAGGQGTGLVAALAGARPLASLDASRLADGRLALHTLKITGAGLKLDASGGVGFLGDLNFKGGATLTNLAAARPGARGTITAKWSAAQSRADQPWRLSAQLSGDGLATGQAQADHLLGPRPQLRLEAACDKGAWSVARAELTGAAAALTTKGTVARDGGLNLTVDGSASGPLDIGPLVLAGKLRTTGVITGALATPHAELQAQLGRLDLPRLSLTDARLALSLARDATGWGGRFGLTGGGDYGPAHARADFRYAGDRLDLSGLDLDAGGLAAQGGFGLSDWNLVAADLALTLQPGAFADQGRADVHLRLIDQGAGPVTALSLTGANLKLKGQTAVIQTAKLTANGPLSRLSYTLMTDIRSDQAPLKLSGQGQASGAQGAVALSFNGAGRFRNTDFSTEAPAQVTLRGDDRAARLDLSVGGGRAQIKLDQAGPALKAGADLTGVDLGALGENLAGRFDASLSLQGQGERLDGQLDARLKGARSRDAPSKLALDGAVKAALADGRLTVDATANGAATHDQATAHVVLAALAGAAPFHFALDRTQPISGALSANGELQPIWDLFFGGERELGGQLTADATLGGDLAAPKLTGHASLSQGTFEDAATGLKLRDLAADAQLDNESLDLERFSAKDAHAGQLTGAGRLSFAAGGASTLKLQARGFQLLDNESAKATASGAITATRDAQGRTKLTGDLTIDRADIQAASSRAPPDVVTMEVIERNKPAGQADALRPPPTTGPALQLDVRLTAPRHIYVKGLGLDAELSLDAQVVGDTSAPILQGEARVVRGIYDFAGKRFDIDDTGVVELASTPDQIRLDLTATLADPTLTAVIGIKGTAAKPQITLTSTPALPSDEVLSQVLFGQSAAQLSPVQAAQLAAAVTTLATGGGFDIMGGLGKFARLDRVALGGTAATGVTVSGGKYIGNNIYLELTGGGRQGPSAQVEIRATRSLSLISQIGGDVGAKLSVRWRTDYGKAAGSSR